MAWRMLQWDTAEGIGVPRETEPVTESADCADVHATRVSCQLELAAERYLIERWDYRKLSWRIGMVPEHHIAKVKCHHMRGLALETAAEGVFVDSLNAEMADSGPSIEDGCHEVGLQNGHKSALGDGVELLTA